LKFKVFSAVCIYSLKVSSFDQSGLGLSCIFHDLTSPSLRAVESFIASRGSIMEEAKEQASKREQAPNMTTQARYTVQPFTST